MQNPPGDLARSERTFRSLFERNPQPMFLLDRESFRYMAVNEAALTLYGYSRSEFIALAQTDLRLDGEHDQLRHDRRALTTGRKTHFQATRHRTKDGSVLDVEIDVAEVDFEGRPAFVTVIHNVTDLVRLQVELEHQAFHDQLTGLPNRALFTDRVGHALARSARENQLLAVVFLDIDNFKVINDSLGHAAGDDLLVKAAGRLQAQLRSEDTAARFGGDEFAVLLEHVTTASDAADICRRIARALRVPVVVRGTTVSMQVSLGIAYSTDATDAEQLLRNADVAMYGAKAGGKGRFQLYEPEMHQRVARRLQMESDLRHAVRRGELRAHYQPIWQLPGLRLVGVEALVRWLHPVRGLIPPLEFIGVAEDTGLILELGRWMLNEACAQIARWQQEIMGFDDLNAAVNISPRQLEDPAIVDDVRQALRASGLKPAKLVLEVTEGILVRDVASAAARLSALKALGVKLAIDDFGTGHSSLSQLRRFPVDILKVDKSFVDAIDKDRVAADMLSVVVKLGESLGLDVVAEGVESSEQAAVLQRLGNIYVQGYLYARPCDAESMTTFLAEHSRLRSPSSEGSP